MHNLPRLKFSLKGMTVSLVVVMAANIFRDVASIDAFNDIYVQTTWNCHPLVVTNAHANTPHELASGWSVAGLTKRMLRKLCELHIIFWMEYVNDVCNVWSIVKLLNPIFVSRVSATISSMLISWAGWNTKSFGSTSSMISIGVNVDFRHGMFPVSK